ncbi:MAG: hypothetical protein ACI87E_004872 [Mariniblastus sp.]|jgi:hypothetical protein
MAEQKKQTPDAEYEYEGERNLLKTIVFLKFNARLRFRVDSNSSS